MKTIRACLIKVTEEDTNKWENILFSWIGSIGH